MRAKLSSKELLTAIFVVFSFAAVCLFLPWVDDDAPYVLDSPLIVRLTKIFLLCLMLPGTMLSAIGSGVIHLPLAVCLNGLFYGGSYFALAKLRRKHTNG